MHFDNVDNALNSNQATGKQTIAISTPGELINLLNVSGESGELRLIQSARLQGNTDVDKHYRCDGNSIQG